MLVTDVIVPQDSSSNHVGLSSHRKLATADDYRDNYENFFYTTSISVPRKNKLFALVTFSIMLTFCQK